MHKLATFRKAAAVVLLACFVLPLSKCASSGADGAPSYDYRFPYEHIVQGIDDIRAQGTAVVDSVPFMLATVLVFLAPAAMLRLRATLQAGLHVLLAVPAEWLLYHWSTVGQPQIGGILAMAAWAVLFALGLTASWQALASLRSGPATGVT